MGSAQVAHLEILRRPAASSPSATRLRQPQDDSARVARNDSHERFRSLASMPRFTFPDTHGDLIGAHISTKGGLHTVFERASLINASAIALFAKNSNQWKGKTMTEEDVALFAKLRNVKPIFTHASYLINLASTNEVVHGKAIEAMGDELDRAERLGI